jgi:hypothetical protein
MNPRRLHNETIFSIEIIALLAYRCKGKKACKAKNAKEQQEILPPAAV